MPAYTTTTVCIVNQKLQYLLLPSQATILTLSTLATSWTSLNSTSFSINVQTLSQNLKQKGL